MKPNQHDHPDHLECPEFMKKVVASLDGSLSLDEERELLEEIKHHNCCLEQINIARCYKSFLAQKVNKEKIDPSIVEEIRLRIAREEIA